MKNVIFQYNPWWEQKFSLKNIIPRKKYMDILKFNLKNEQIIFLTGLRRIGKTTLLKLLAQDLIKTGIPATHILYVSLDDYLFKNHTILEILDEYRKIHKLPLEKKIYLLFDEIIYKKNFHQQLKTIFDRQHTKIFATSSSSIKLKDTKAFLTGRSYTIEVNPLTFEEYLEFKDIEILQRDRHLVEPYFMDFLQSGGIPYHVLHTERDYITGLVDDIIYKDIISEHRIKNPQMIKDYFLLLMERSGKQLSINKIATILNISVDSSKKYLSYFNDTFLIHLLSRHGKTNEKILSPKKIYCSDLGIKFIFTGLHDLGSYFENYIYLKLRHHDLYYLYENSIEIDFYIKNTGSLIESKFNSRMNKKQALLFESFKAKERFVIDSVENLKTLKKFEKIENGIDKGLYNNQIGR